MAKITVDGLLSGQQYNFKHKIKNTRYKFLELARITTSMFDYEGLPPSIDKNLLEFFIQQAPCIITKKDNELIILKGGFCDIPKNNYIPDKFLVTSIEYDINGKIYTVGKDSVLCYNDNLYLGVGNILSKYARLLTEIELTLYMGNTLSRAQVSGIGTTDQNALSLEKYFEGIENGEIKAITDKSLTDGLKLSVATQPVSATLTNIIELNQYVKASFFNEFGLNSNYNMKRESINSVEAQMDNDALIPLKYNMLKARKKWVKEVNEMYGTNISVKFSEAWEDKKPLYNDIKEEAETEEIIDEI